MKFTLKIAVEIKRSHADDPAEQLPSCTEAQLDLARGWDHDTRSPTVAARFGFSQSPKAIGGGSGG